MWRVEGLGWRGHMRRILFYTLHSPLSTFFGRPRPSQSRNCVKQGACGREPVAAEYGEGAVGAAQKG